MKKFIYFYFWFEYSCNSFLLTSEYDFKFGMEDSLIDYIEKYRRIIEEN